MKTSPKLILASQSPRREQLLELGGIPFELRTPKLNEDPLEGETPDAYVLRLAEQKARAVAANLSGDAVVLAADTTVVHENRILGKPADAVEARAMLESLSGRSHEVYSGIAILELEGGEMHTDLALSIVPMRSYTAEEIEAYIATGDPFDKAGAYAIQNDDFSLVTDFADCFANVMGLPLCHLQRNLRKRGIGFPVDIAAACQDHLGYDCPVHERILQWKQ